MEKKIIISISTGKLQVLLSLMTTFLVISAIRTLKQTFAKDINLHHRKSWAKEHLVEFGRAKKKSSQFVNKKKLAFKNASSEIQFGTNGCCYCPT